MGPHAKVQQRQHRRWLSRDEEAIARKNGAVHAIADAASLHQSPWRCFARNLPHQPMNQEGGTADNGRSRPRHDERAYLGVTINQPRKSRFVNADLKRSFCTGFRNTSSVSRSLFFGLSAWLLAPFPPARSQPNPEATMSQVAPTSAPASGAGPEAASRKAQELLRRVYTPKPDLWLGLDILRFPTADYVRRLRKEEKDIRWIPPFLAYRPATGRDTIVDGTPRPTVTVKQQEIKTRPMELTEARQLALQYQLDIKADLIAPAIAHAQLIQAWSKFDWMIGGQAVRAVEKPGTTSNPQTIDDTAQVTLTIPSPLGGGVQLSMPLSKYQLIPSPAGVPSPYYSTTPVVSISQPLLQGAGLRINMASINLARLSSEQSEAQARLLITNLLANVDRAYWQLWGTRQFLDVRYEQFELAQRQLAHAESLAAGGLVPKLEITRSRVGVSQRVNAIITSENQRRVQERNFKRVLNAPGLSLDTPDVILPLSVPDLAPLVLDSGKLVELALQERMDLLVAQLQVAASLVNRDVARNQVLPDVSLFFEGSRTTLGLNQQDTLNRYKDGPKENWTGGVKVSIPIGSIGSRARYRQAALQYTLALNNLEQRKTIVVQDVYDAVDSVVQSWQQIQAATEEIAMTQQIYEGEQQLFERGIRTSTEVLEAADFVANAKIRRASAIAAFEIAKVELAYAVGAHLGYDRIELVPHGERSRAPRMKP